jgi:superfamily I DNA and/or RNA helicase
MVLRKSDLLVSLEKLRDTIREEEASLGRKTIVCTDKVLEEIALKQPLKTSDFLAIQGIGRQFVDKYGSLFLKVVLEYRQQTVNEVRLSKNAFKILDHYKDRLANISKNNPNLYTGRITLKNNFDLTSLNSYLELVGFLSDKHKIRLPLSVSEKQDYEHTLKHITTLYREVNKDEKETGSYDLHIAYPYIEGVFKTEKFPIRAPLMFVPVKLERKRKDFFLVKDTDKDIVFNRDLLLASSKFEQIDFEGKLPFIQDASQKTLQNIVIPFYEKNGFEIAQNSLDYSFEPFENIHKDRFLKTKKGIFNIKEYITLGRYRLHSSMIQKDMDTILSSKKYNDLLEGLIDEKNLYKEQKQSFVLNNNSTIFENRLSYINPLNYSQEKVINLLEKERKLVIWGPPGTGKSQTITSLISSAVLKGQNVLVVSEKKVALDVILSRLQRMSRYVMFIDDAENKQAFYERLRHFVDPVQPSRSRNNDIYELEENIEETFRKLDRGLELMYHESIQYIPIFRLFNRYISDKNVQTDLTPKKVHKMFKEVFKNINFKQLKKLEKTFDTNTHLKEFIEYKTIVQQFPLFKKLNTKLSRSHKIDLENFTIEFEHLQKELKTTCFFKKGRLKKTFIQKNQDRLLYLTKKKYISKLYLKVLFKDQRLHNYLMIHLNKVNKIRNKYNKLSNLENRFLMMCMEHRYVQGKDVVRLREYLFNAYYTGYIEDFFATHQEYLYIFEKYVENKKNISNWIDEKRLVTTETFEMELYKHALKLLDSKRVMDIKRILQSDRKISVRAFINRFQVELMDSIRIWMMTPDVVSAVIPLTYGMFDLVIFDEASQMFVEKGIPSIYRAKQVCIAGDTKQLRPSSLGVGRLVEDDEYFEEDILQDISLDAKSLLDLARYKYYETILNYHYRSRYEELIAFSNHAFYEGKLYISPNIDVPKDPPIEYIYVKNGVFDKRRNVKEAQRVIKLLRFILKERMNNETIGVITFNSTQRDLIENLLDDELLKRGKYSKLFEQELFRMEDGEDKSLFIKNIENVQGDERDIIIFSMGYGKDSFGVVHRRFGWLNNSGGQNRLNVAISRAKKKIYFVSSLYPEELKVEDLKSTGPKLLKDYMRYCYYVSKKNEDGVKELLQKVKGSSTIEITNETKRSELFKDVLSRLQKTNFVVKSNVGIGNYTIPLAIMDEENNSYLLGILLDVNTDLDMQGRRDLYHEEMYLESRGWKVYRVFSSNWYKNPNKEMRTIRNLLK